MSPKSPVKKFEEMSGLSIRKSKDKRFVTLEQKIQRGEKNLNEAMKKLQDIADFKVADWMSVKEFNKKVQALNYSRKLHKYTNMG